VRDLRTIAGAFGACVALVVTAAALAGCSKGGEPTTPATPPAEAPAPAEKPAAQETPSLGQRYKAAMALMDRGEYSKAYTALEDIKETVEDEKLEISDATRRSIDQGIATCVEKMRESQAAPAPKTPDALMDKINTMAAKYQEASDLMKRKEYAGALTLYLEVQTLSKDLGGRFAESDRKALEDNIAACRKALVDAPVEAK